MLHWTIWGREPGVHEASLCRYGSKLVYHITVYFLFTLVTVTCKHSTFTQLTCNFVSYNSCSNWRPANSMKIMKSAYKILPHPDKYSWFVLSNWLHGHQVPYLKLFTGASLGCVVSHSKHTRDICQGAAESCTPMSWLHWGWWTSTWATVIRCKMLR